LARHQVDPKSCSQIEEVAPRVAVTFGKLIDQLLDAGGGLGDDLLLFSLPQRYLSTERPFEQSLEVGYVMKFGKRQDRSARFSRRVGWCSWSVEASLKKGSQLGRRVGPLGRTCSD
jgi:hypothetical protein